MNTGNHLYTMGANEFGQLGYETKEIYTTKLKEVYFPEIESNDAFFVTQVECGAYHTVIKFYGDIVYGCGQNNYGQIGTYKEEFIIEPKKWNYDYEYYFRNKLGEKKVLSGIKCSNGITCLFFKNESQTEKEIDYSKERIKYHQNKISTENMPLRSSN